MTPTLIGRWESRLLLLSTIGALVTFGFSLIFTSLIPIILLILVLAFGFIWDILFDRLQRRRWDHDWPPLYQLAAGFAEFIGLGLIVYTFPFIPAPAVWQFFLHYWIVWLAVFIASQSIMRIYFPRWRFEGGRWLQ